jgi:ABC-type uncharacterized transport system substrate-binding protein
MAEPKRILALAVGDPNFSQLIDHPSKPYGVRPYISGLIEGLSKRTPARTLGTDSDYVIDYRQRWHQELHQAQPFGDMQEADLIYVMSTSVMHAAGRLTNLTKKPLIVFSNCSDHKLQELVHAKRATGYSAQRPQSAGDCFDRFLRTVPTLKEVFILHKSDYDPSDKAVKLIQTAAAAKGVETKVIEVTSLSDLQEQLSRLPERPAGAKATVGLQVAPADLLFATTPWIIKHVQEAKRLPVFFPVTDWVPSGLGGYGVSQFLCGVRTADHVDKILWSKPGQEFTPEVVEAPLSDFEWAVSRAAAKALKLEIPKVEVEKKEMHIV